MVSVRVAILGGRGMLGSDVADECRSRSIAFEAVDLPEFDIADSAQLEDVVRGADVVVNCAAYTDVDGAEMQRDLAYRVNGEAVGRLGTLAAKAGKWVLHISTDFVFDGRLNRPYIETDLPNPINEYGRSKLEGEKRLAESGCACCILRVEWTYGRRGKNFVEKLLARAKKTGELRVVDDQVGSPTATTEVAKTICRLLEIHPQGTYHFAGDGYVSRYEMARFIVDKLGLNVSVAACKSRDFPSPAARPLNSRFDCSKIKSLLDGPIEPWQGPLERFLEQS